MKLLFSVLLVFAPLIDPGDIRKINTAKAEAKKAYLAGDFKAAAEKYRYLIDSLGVDEEEVRMNLANASFESNDTTGALNNYLPLTTSKNTRLKSVALQQLGVLNNRQGKLEEALANFKEALRTDPTNEDARYNYEMVKKKIEEQKKQEQQKQDQKDKQQQDQNKDSKDQKDQNKDQQQKDQQKKEEQDKKEQEKKDQQDKEKQDKEKQQQQKDQEQKEQDPKEEKQIPPSVQEKLKDMNMTEEKAKMILEAMKNQEVQYLQQNKRKASKPKDKGKPDW